jgi:hypothetical protein
MPWWQQQASAAFGKPQPGFPTKSQRFQILVYGWQTWLFGIQAECFHRMARYQECGDSAGFATPRPPKPGSGSPGGGPLLASCLIIGTLGQYPRMRGTVAVVAKRCDSFNLPTAHRLLAGWAQFAWLVGSLSRIVISPFQLILQL